MPVNRTLRSLLLAGLALLSVAAGRPPAPDTWSGWYNLPSTSVDVRYRTDAAAADGDEQHRIRWQFRNRHPFAVSFDYHVRFQHRHGDQIVSGKEVLAPGAESAPRVTVARQILDVKLRHVLRL